MALTNKELHDKFIALMTAERFGWGDELKDGKIEDLLEKGTILNREGKRIPGKAGRSEEDRQKLFAKALKKGHALYVYRKGEKYPREVRFNKEKGDFTVSEPIDKVKLKEVKKPHWFKRYYLNLFSLMFRFKSLKSVSDWRHYDHEKEAFKNAMDERRVERRMKNDPLLKEGREAEPEKKPEKQEEKQPEKREEKQADAKQNSYEELLKRFEELQKQITELRTELQEEKKRNAELQKALKERQKTPAELQEEKDIKTAVENSLKEQKTPVELQEKKDLETAIENSLKDQEAIREEDQLLWEINSLGPLYDPEEDEPEPMNLDGKEAVGKAEKEKDFYQKLPAEEEQESAVKGLDVTVENPGAKREEAQKETLEAQKTEPEKTVAVKKDEEEFAVIPDDNPDKSPCDKLLDQMKKNSILPVTEQMEKNLRTLYQNSENAVKHLQQMNEAGARYRGGEEVKQIVAFESVKRQIEQGKLSPHAAAILGTDQGVKFLTAGGGLSEDMKHAVSSAHAPDYFRKNFLDGEGLKKMTDAFDQKMFGFVNDHVKSSKELENSLNMPEKNPMATAPNVKAPAVNQPQIPTPASAPVNLV